MYAYVLFASVRVQAENRWHIQIKKVGEQYNVPFMIWVEGNNRASRAPVSERICTSLTPA